MLWQVVLNHVRGVVLDIVEDGRDRGREMSMHMWCLGTLEETSERECAVAGDVLDGWNNALMKGGGVRVAVQW